MSVREDVLHASLLDELKKRLASSEGVATARKRIVERVATLGREHNSRLREKRAQRAKMESEIEGLIAFITAGNGTNAVAIGLKKREREITVLREEVAALERSSSAPPKLPTIDEMMKLVFDRTAPHVRHHAGVKSYADSSEKVESISSHNATGTTSRARRSNPRRPHPRGRGRRGFAVFCDWLRGGDFDAGARRFRRLRVVLAA